MAQRNFDREFAGLMICAATHDDKIWARGEHYVKRERSAEDLVDFDAKVIGYVAEYYALSFSDIMKVLLLHHPHACDGVVDGQA